MSQDGTFVAVSAVKGTHGVSFRLAKMIKCPLNESHIILKADFQSHLERCLIGDLTEMTCPWNSTHVVDETSYENHKHNCLDKPQNILPIQPSDIKLDLLNVKDESQDSSIVKT